MSDQFSLQSTYSPKGSQPEAIEELTETVDRKKSRAPRGRKKPK